MINVSNTFKEKLQDGEQVIEIVEITFADGTTKTLENEIMIGNNDFSDCAESSSFPVGATVCKTMKLELDNTEDQWKDYNFYQAKVHTYLKLQTSVAEPASESIWMNDFYEPILDTDGNSIVLSRAASEDRYETIDKGVYTITTPEQYGEILSFTAMDDMYKTNAKYYSALTLPQPIMALVRDACESLNIPMGFSSMAHGNVIVTALPDNMTFRQLIGWAAMLETANARIDNRGYLQFIKWNFGAVENGSLVPLKLEDYVNSPTLSSDDIVITGIRVKNKESESLFGTAGYVLELENNLLSDSDLGTVAAWIGGNLVGAKFRNLQGDLLYNPLLEFGDMARSFDRNGNGYLTPITDVSSPLNGITTVKTQADDPIRNSSTYMSEATKALVEARQLVKDERTEREKAVERLANTLKESGGLYMTEDPQDDGSVIYYMHNKPTLEESDIVWKLTAEAIGISTDGGKTYPYGFTVTGEMITRLLYAEGINASYINAGALIVRDTNGKIIFSADIDNNQIVIDGASVRIGASPLDGLLNSMQGQIDGNINTWTGTPAPTLSNYPANEWLTDTEMSKHVGDLYYDGDSHAYRFRNDGKGYYWERLKDTDVTKALQDSEDALAAAKSAQEAAALAKNMTLQLSNEYQGVSVDSDGNYGTFPSNVSTQAVVMYGTQDITSDCSYTISKSDGVDGTWDISTKTYTVTGLNTDNGWIDIKATYLETLSVSKRFSISKQYAGEKGDQGVPGRTYFIEMSSGILKRGQDNKVSPNSITAKAYYRDGDKAERKEYKGRWKVQTSTDGSTYSNVLASIVDESEKSYTVGSLDRSVIYIRFMLYEAGGNSNQLDIQTIPILIDVDALTHEEILNLLTNDGAIKGIYKEGNQLYISFTYAKGGTLKLGGPNNGYGTFEVYDADGNVICKINNTDGFKNIKGSEWAQIKESIFSAGYGSLTDGVLDLSAQYDDGRHVVLSAISGDLIFKISRYFRIEGLKAVTSGSSMLYNSSSYYAGYSSASSKRYKVLGKTVREDELEDLYRIKVIWAKYKDGYLMEQDERCGKEMPMFIAEDIDRRFPIAVDHNEKGHAENWNYRIMIPCMFAMLKNEHEKVKNLQSDLDSVKAELNELKQLIKQHISMEV